MYGNHNKHWRWRRKNLLKIACNILLAAKPPPATA
jgi:hypothetical protein